MRIPTPLIDGELYMSEVSSLSYRPNKMKSQRHHQPSPSSTVPSPALRGLGCMVNACTLSLNGTVFVLSNCGIKPPALYWIIPISLASKSLPSILSTENMTYTVCGSRGSSSPSGFLIGKKDLSPTHFRMHRQI